MKSGPTPTLLLYVAQIEPLSAFCEIVFREPAMNLTPHDLMKSRHCRWERHITMNSATNSEFLEALQLIAKEKDIPLDTLD